MAAEAFLLMWSAEEAGLRVFLHSALNCWCPLPGSGQREVGELPDLLVVRKMCQEGESSWAVSLVANGDALSVFRRP